VSLPSHWDGKVRLIKQLGCCRGLWSAVDEYLGSGCGDVGYQADAGIERGSEAEYLFDYRVSLTRSTELRRS
jgi:hypothetical protein